MIPLPRASFVRKALASTVAAAFAAPSAFADNGMPGAGLVVRNQGNVTVNATPLPGGNQIIGLTTGATIQNTNAAASSTVIQWGSPGVVDSANKGGFNVAAKNVLNFTSAAAGSGFLNIDISGNLSTIAGKVTADGNSVLAIANAKGITIASGATIVAPVGFAAIGANMNTIDAINSWDPTGGATGKMNFAAGAPVTIQGDLSGVGAYLVVAGSDSVNLSPSKGPATSKLPITVIGGVGSSYDVTDGDVTLSDQGAANQTTVFQSQANSNVTIGLGSAKAPQDATYVHVYANGNLTNNGFLEFGNQGGNIPSYLQFTGVLNNTGTIQSSASSIDFEPTTTSFYNNGKSQVKFGGLNNSGTIQAPNGYVDWNAPTGDVTNSGTILGGSGYVVVGASDGAINNSGTIHGAKAVNSWVTLDAESSSSSKPHDVTNTGTITSDNSYVELRSSYGNVTNGATGTISAATSVYIGANVDTDGTFGSSTNLGTIQLTGPDARVWFYNGGAGNQMVGGTVAATGTGTLGFFEATHNPGPVSTSGGTTTINTPLSVMHDSGFFQDGIFISAQNIVLNSTMTVAEATTGAGAADIEFFGTSSNTTNSVAVNANLTAGGFFTQVANHGTNFTFAPFSQNWTLNGNLTTTKGGDQFIELHDLGNLQGAGVLTANKILLEGFGDFNHPVSNDFLLNGLNITTVGSDPVVTITARGPGPQAINLHITGDVTLTSGETVEDTINPGNLFGYGCFNTPLCNYVPEPNAGSNLITQASGTLTIAGNNYPTSLLFLGRGTGETGGGGPSGVVTAGSVPSGPQAAPPIHPQQCEDDAACINVVASGVSNSNGFLFPGSLVFITPGTLNVNTIVDNAYGGTVAPFQGQWYQGSVINDTLPLYTNGNARINFSVHPNGSPILPAVFTATETHDLFGFNHLVATLNPNATFLNTYTIIEQAFVHGQDWLSLISNTPIH